MPSISKPLLDWYKKNKRNMPWRDHPDPYAVWVSEIMLQQTRVDTVIPYFEKWMRLFPTVKDLAKANEQDVLNAWEGLGYYSRARNLRKAAKIVSEKFNGQLPRDLKDLQSLPGVGRYTVGAIASMAFGMDKPTLDGNLRRIYARLFDVDKYADSKEGDKYLWDLAAQNLPKGQAGDYNQALMDLGATVCVPKNPMCGQCPLAKLCEARKNGTIKIRPLLKSKKKAPSYIHAAAIIRNGKKVLLTQRPIDGLLGGMWEFPNARVEADPAKELSKAIKAAYRLKVKIRRGVSIPKYEAVNHAYTHFKVAIHPFECELLNPPDIKRSKWIDVNKLNDFPMGKTDREISKKIGRG